MYLKEHGFIKSEADKIDFKLYGLPELKDIKGLKKLTYDDSITPDNASQLWQPDEGKNYMGFSDYLGRKFKLSNDTFTKHTTGHYTNDNERRHQLMPLLIDILQTPDEVYFTKYEQRKGGKAFFQTNYLKFYEDNIIVVNTRTGSNGVEINTIFRAKVAEEKTRQGYLIHKKNRT